jgi:hypothetical protein
MKSDLPLMTAHSSFWLVLAPIFLVVGLTACGMGPNANPDDVGPYPDNYRDIVKAEVLKDYYDPSSLQDFFIAAPFQGRLDFTDGWVVCFRVNAKNQLGGYTGEQEHSYLIYDGSVVQQGDQAGCPDAEYTEWTQMEGLGLGTKSDNK